jgi:hypothetical protein
MVLVVSCAAKPPLDCAAVRDSDLRSFPFNEVAQDIALRWIGEQYGISSSVVSVRPSTAEITYLDWEINGRDYGLALWNVGKPTASASMSWPTASFTISDALLCLGQPTLYRAYYDRYPEAMWTRLDLLYPDSGILLSTTVRRKVLRFDEHTEIGGATYAEPGTQQELISRFWVVQPDSEAYDHILNSLRLWPGEIKDVTINVDD